MNEDDDTPAIRVLLMIIFCSSKNIKKKITILNSLPFFFRWHTDGAVELKTESVFLTLFCGQICFVPECNSNGKNLFLIYKY